MHPAFFEIPLCYLCLALFNWRFLPDTPAFFGLDPHPYWIGVLLFSVRYGLAAGAAAGAVAAVCYLTIVWYTLEPYLFSDLTFYALPGWFLLIGTMIGAAVSHYRQQRDQARSAELESTAHIDALQEALALKAQITAQLEERIVTQTSSLISVYEGARKFSAVSEAELYPGILDYLATVLEADAAALHLRTPDGWRLACTHGWQPDAPREPHRAADTGLIGLAGTQNRIVSLRDFAQPGMPTAALPQFGDAIVAGPLRDGEEGAVIGVVSIQKIPFLKLTSSTVTLFSFLLNWAARSLAQSRYIRGLQAHAIVDPQWDVCTAGYLARRGLQEFERSQRYYLPLSYGAIRLRLPATLPPRQQQRMRYLLGQLLIRTVRDIDLVGLADADGSDFHILWLTASPSQVDAQCALIRDRFAELQHAPPAPHNAPNLFAQCELQCQVAHFTPQCADFSALKTAATMPSPA